eukprot:1491165-Alexandrium_andersonii.AAC.1
MFVSKCGVVSVAAAATTWLANAIGSGAEPTSPSKSLSALTVAVSSTNWAATKYSCTHCQAATAC